MSQLLDAAAVRQWKLDNQRRLKYSDGNSSLVFAYLKVDADEFLAKLVAELESERRITVAMADSLGETVEILGGDENDLAPAVAREVAAQRDGLLAALKAIEASANHDPDDHVSAYHLASQAIAEFDPDPELADAIGGDVESPKPNLSQNMNATYDAAYAHGLKDGAIAAYPCKMGVGTGDGDLFVYGDHESIKAAQAIVLAGEEARAELQKKATCIENCMAIEADLRAELEKRTDQLFEMRADRNGLFDKLQAAREQAPIGTFTGKFYGDVNGRSFFEVKCFDALPTAGSHVYSAPVPAMPVEVTDAMAEAFKVAFHGNGPRVMDDYMSDVKVGLRAALGVSVAMPIPKQEPFGYFVDIEYHGFTRTKPDAKFADATTALYADPVPAIPTTEKDSAVAVPDELPVEVLDAVSEALGDCYDCMRTWGAWAHGTMSQGDFVEVRESSDRVDEIARAAITAYVGSQQGVVAQQLDCYAIDCLKDQSMAWQAVVKTLGEVAVGWHAIGKTGIDAACMTIRDMAAQPSKAVPAQQPIELAFREGWACGWTERHTSHNNDIRVTPWLIPVANLNRDWEASDAKKHCAPEVAPLADPDNVWERAVIEAAEAVVRANQNNTGNEPSCSVLARAVDELRDVLNDNSLGYKPSPAVAMPEQVAGYITGDCYEAGLWSRQNIEAFVRDGNTVGGAKPVPTDCVEPDRTGMYFYKVDSCTAKLPDAHDCICWHRIGTGPLPNLQPDAGGAS